jgi:hydroxyacylglutathione hydrolase
MASTSETAKHYIESLSAHRVDEAAAMWAPGGIDRFIGDEDLVAPDGVRAYFLQLFEAFPDFSFEILEVTTQRNRSAVRSRVTATFAGPGHFQGFAPNGARIDTEVLDLLTVSDGLIQHNEAFLNTGAVMRQLGVLPPAGSKAQQRLTKLTNSRTKFRSRIHGVDTERIADGVWLVRGGFPAKTMNVYLIEDEGGLTMFDAGISDMTAALGAVVARMGGIKRIVLGHADCDHRGSAPGFDAPVYCHAADRAAAESDAAFRDYWDISKLAAYARPIYPKMMAAWDGGAVEIEATLSEGQEIAGFRVIELPGHAPGLIGLFRDSDRLALVSDCFYTLDPQTGIKNEAHVPHPAFNADTEQARASIRKLAELDPSVAWAGHADPVTGDTSARLEHAASAPA